MLLSTFLRRSASEQARDNQQCYADTEHTVCEVKRRPVVSAVINVDKIPHQAVIKNSVVEIAANTGCEQSESNVKQSLAGSAEKKERKYHN